MPALRVKRPLKFAAAFSALVRLGAKTHLIDASQEVTSVTSVNARRYGVGYGDRGILLPFLNQNTVSDFPYEKPDRHALSNDCRASCYINSDLSPTELCRKHRTEAVPSEPNGFVTDVDATFKQQILDLTQRQRIADVHDQSQSNDLRHEGPSGLFEPGLT